MTSLRTTLLLPTALFMLLWGVYAAFLGQESQVSAGVPLAVLAVLLVVSAANVEVFLLRPLRRLKQGVQHWRAAVSPGRRSPAAAASCVSSPPGSSSCRIGCASTTRGSPRNRSAGTIWR